jgi:hypothetical protein
MSTTDNNGETPGERGHAERPSQRLHGLYRADLRPFAQVSDAQLLGAIDRAEIHDRQDDAPRSDVAAHLGFAHNSWTTRRLRSQLDALRSAGRIRDVRRCGLNLLSLTAAGRRVLGKARSVGEVILPEAPQHRICDTHARSLTSGSTRSVKHSEGRWPRLALCSTPRKSLGCVVRSRRASEKGVLAARLGHPLPARVARARRLTCRHRRGDEVPRTTQRLAMGPAMKA